MFPFPPRSLLPNSTSNSHPRALHSFFRFVVPRFGLPFPRPLRLCTHDHCPMIEGFCYLVFCIRSSPLAGFCPLLPSFPFYKQTPLLPVHESRLFPVDDPLLFTDPLCLFRLSPGNYGPFRIPPLVHLPLKDFVPAFYQSRLLAGLPSCTSL